MNALISADELRALLDEREVRVLDARWQLGRDDGREQYLAGHVPGAVFVDVERDLSRHGEPRDGRHPVPSDDDFAAAVRRWGVQPGVPVVVYDDARMLPASRLWWALRRAGVTDVRVLDGGWRAWQSAGGAVQTGDVAVEPSDIDVISPGAEGMIETADAATWPRTGILVDVRAAERYRGETEPIDPRAGHIPGAISVPYSGNVDADGRFLPAADLRRRFAAAGVPVDGSDVIVYCGSGVTATHGLLALELAGIRGRLLPGSWSQWSADPSRAVATGPMP